MKTTRRDFLKVGATIAGVASGVSAASEAVLAAVSTAEALPSTTTKGDMLYRNLGHTGAQVSALGVGGHHLVIYRMWMTRSGSFTRQSTPA